METNQFTIYITNVVVDEENYSFNYTFVRNNNDLKQGKINGTHGWCNIVDLFKAKLERGLAISFVIDEIFQLGQPTYLEKM